MKEFPLLKSFMYVIILPGDIFEIKTINHKKTLKVQNQSGKFIFRAINLTKNHLFCCIRMEEF